MSAEHLTWTDGEVGVLERSQMDHVACSKMKMRSALVIVRLAERRMACVGLGGIGYADGGDGGRADVTLERGMEWVHVRCAAGD